MFAGIDHVEYSRYLSENLPRFFLVFLIKYMRGFEHLYSIRGNVKLSKGIPNVSNYRRCISNSMHSINIFWNILVGKEFNGNLPKSSICCISKSLS